MRRLVLALAVAASATSASANPLDFLRGAIMDGVGGPRPEWSGYYAGVHAGTGTSDINFAQSGSDIIGQLLVNTAMENEYRVSDWPVMGKKSSGGSGIGGFIGYNAQWGDAVLGFELNYIRGKFGGSDTGSMSRIFGTSNGYINDVTLTGTSSIEIKDMGSARLRAGWAAGIFMPYLFGGASLGIADITRTVTVVGTQTLIEPPNTVVPFALTQTVSQPGHFIYGYAVGGGVDIMLAGNAFLRGEFEYLKFAAPIDTSVTTVRGGLGMKF